MSQYLGQLSADVLVVPSTTENCAYAQLHKYFINIFGIFLFPLSLATIGDNFVQLVQLTNIINFFGFFLDVAKLIWT